MFWFEQLASYSDSSQDKVYTLWKVAFYFSQVTEYVYESEMEEAYRASLFKSFSKTLEDGFFPLVIVDAIHSRVS